jgi:flavin-dependent thymidylate synthase
MRVVLAGYNVDAEVLREAAQRGVSPDRLTPEILSAAYARISRNPAPVEELRAQAREEVAKARASNEQIVFGMGHASVAEHAVFNFDLMGLSRLAIEALEAFRLCSYTEKSQRYIKLEDELVVPPELAAAGLEPRLRKLADLQRHTYDVLYSAIVEQLGKLQPELLEDKAGRRALEGRAKEDARYVTSLAVEGQLGLTANARSLEHLVRRLNGHPLQEVRELATRLAELARAVAPSLIRHLEPPAAGDAWRCPAELRSLAREILDPDAGQTLPGETGAVQLVGGSGGGDAVVVAALLHAASTTPWSACEERARALSPQEQGEVIRAALRPLGLHQAPPRAFETVSLRFDVVVSASCFAQLKRHRMATLVPQPYDPSLGFTVPDTVKRVGLMPDFQRVMAESSALYDELAAHSREVAPYALTQAHRRRVLLQINARELYHFARLRLDQHAQWDIRRLAERLLNLARRELPHTLCLACGKDELERKRAEIFPGG